MDEVDYPFSGNNPPARVIGFTIDTRRLGQSRLTYPATGAVDVVDRGKSQFFGTLTVLPLQATLPDGKQSYRPNLRRILEFMRDMKGSASSYEQPLEPASDWGPQVMPDDPQDYRTLVVREVTVRTFGTQGSLNLFDLDGDSDYAATVGDYVNFGDRLEVLRVAGQSFTGLPGRWYLLESNFAPAIGSRMDVLNPFLRARLAPPFPSIVRTGYQAGPMTFNWEEVL